MSHAGACIGEISGKAQADDGEEVWVEKGCNERCQLDEEVGSPLVSGWMGALYKVVVSFIWAHTVGTAVVVACFAEV